jgi:twitching motility protein PilT
MSGHHLDALFRYCQERGGSDLHLVTGLEPRIRRHGKLEAVEGRQPLDAEALRALLREIVTDDQWREFEETGDLDLAYGLPGVARFRCNYLEQHNGPSAVFRAIPQEVIPLSELGMPKVLGELAHLSRGLVLITGPTGSGKSTTLAAVIHEINRTYARHVVTIEEPVEFLHQPLRSVFSQREIGTDTDSFSSALRSAVRQDADVILVGEMRDLETISLAITAAEMGSLVFGTLHTNGAANTIDRLIDAFPTDQQAQTRVTLAESLSAVVSQMLMPTADGAGRVAAVEILLRTSGLPNVIREGNTPMIRNIIQGGRARGMQLMDDALEELVKSGNVAPRDAYLKASEKQRFEGYLEGSPDAAPPPSG